MKQKFARVPYPACLDKTLTRNDLLVLNALCLHADKKGECFPSYKALESLTNIDQSNIGKSITKLDNKNYLKRTSRRNKYGSQISNLYQILGLATSHEENLKSIENTGKNNNSTPPQSVLPPIISHNTHPTSSLTDTYINELTNQYNKLDQNKFLDYFGGFIKQINTDYYSFIDIIAGFKNIISDFCLYLIDKYDYNFFKIWISCTTHKIYDDQYFLIYEDNFKMVFMRNNGRKKLLDQFFINNNLPYRVEILSLEDWNNHYNSE